MVWWGPGPVARKFATRKLKAHFPFPGRTGWACPVRRVHHRNGATSISCRLVPGNRFHFESLKRARNVILGDVAREGFLGEAVEHALRPSRGKDLQLLATVVGVGTGVAALN